MVDQKWLPKMVAKNGYLKWLLKLVAQNGRKKVVSQNDCLVFLLDNDTHILLTKAFSFVS